MKCERKNKKIVLIYLSTLKVLFTSQIKFIREGGNKKTQAGEQDRKMDGAENAVKQKDKKRTAKQA